MNDFYQKTIDEEWEKLRQHMRKNIEQESPIMQILVGHFREKYDALPRRTKLKLKIKRKISNRFDKIRHWIVLKIDKNAYYESDY